MVAGGVGPLLLHIITTSRHSVPCLMGPRFYFLAIVHWSTVYNAGQLQSVLQSRGAHIVATIVAAIVTRKQNLGHHGKIQGSKVKRGKKKRKEKSNESRAMALLLKKSNYDRTNQ